MVQIIPDRIFLDKLEAVSTSPEDKIAIYATELSVIETLLTMGYVRYKLDYHLFDRKRWLENEIANIESQIKRDYRPAHVIVVKGKRKARIEE